MQCWQCGADVRSGERTCGYCGARLTSPPSAGRSQRSSQQHYPSPRQGSRAPRDESDFTDDYGTDDESTYGAAYPPGDRSRDWRGDRGSRRGARAGDDGDWDDDGGDWDESRQHRRRPPQGRPRPRQEPEAYGSRGQPDYAQSGSYDDYSEDYASKEYDAHEPDPLADPRAPRNLRSTPRRPQEPRSGSRDTRQPPPDAGDMGGDRSRRPPADPSHSRGRGSGVEGKLPPLTEERQGAAQDSFGAYGGADRARRSRPSSADNRYSRSSISRRPPPSREDEYNGGYDEYDDTYDEFGEYGDRRNAPREGYGRRLPPDQRAAYQQRDMQRDAQPRSWQQRWEDTINSVRIPGIRREDGAAGGQPSSRRLVTTIVVLVVLVVTVVGGGIVLVPRVLNRLQPATGTSSTLCTPTGSATAGTLPAPAAHFKQFTSTRSHYGMNYPETWTVEPTQKVANGYDYIDVYTLPQSSTSVTVEQAEAACALSDSNIIQGEVAVAQQQQIRFTENASAATAQTIGGEQWQRREYDVTDKGVTLHMVILACHHQGRAYVIVLVSRTTTFNQDNTGIFQPMLKSFTFTK
ncbi:MAG: zinc-ribbon domain-containing protein [Nitrososphaerota archaeon]